MLHFFSRCLQALLADLQKRWKSPQTEKKRIELRALIESLQRFKTFVIGIILNGNLHYVINTFDNIFTLF